MGKFGIGARVRDEDGDEGVIVGKPGKGYRDVRYETGIAAGCVVPSMAKSFFTPIAANDDEPAPAVQDGKFKVGDEVAVAKKTGRNMPEVGVRGTVVTVYHHDLVSVATEEGTFGYGANELTLAPEWQPKVGDRVRFKTGTPSHCALYSPNPLTVESLGDEGRINILYDPFDGYEEGDLTQTVQVSDLEPLPVAAEAQPAGLTIQPGKYYRTRDGRKVVLRQSDHHEWPLIGDVGAPGGDTYFETDGTSPYLSNLDLVAEWVDEPATPEPAAVAPATATPAFKVGDRVRVKGASDREVHTVATRNSSGSMSLQYPWAREPGLEWWTDDELEPADTPSYPSITTGSIVTLASPAIVTGIDRSHAHLQLASGGSYTLPVSALVPAA